MPQAKAKPTPDASSQPATGPSVELARLVGFAESGSPLIRLPGSDEADSSLEALCTADVSGDDVGRQVTVAFVSGDAARPVVTGVVRAPRNLRARIDGETVTLSADRELVLVCGKSSIHLRRDGKVVIRGEQLVSRASGTNRIRGGSIQLN